ncbi:unnamed protein product [Gongylonema pulchrum]|uniref:Uncharacterized protein n=1 Tax=Gongylonema pulchrum TaxID=637853 RepID=A0A183EIV5_9BILA|nr:unnamed protein product [Gongylonema pulchrum]
MSLSSADDLSEKYGASPSRSVTMASKKKRKKSKGRTIDLDLTLASSNELIQTYEPKICCDENGPKVVSAYASNSIQGSDDCLDVITQLLPVVRQVLP